VIDSILFAVIVTARYNYRMKTYTRDVNTIKRASSDTSQASVIFSRAVDTFWPDKGSRMKTLLLETPDEQDLAAMKSSSRYEQFMSFRCLVVGAVCVWQECWDLLQTCKRKTARPEEYIGRQTESLGRLKTELIQVVEKRCYKQLAMHVFVLQSTYLYLQARRMSTFIKNPRLLSILNGIPEKCTSAMVLGDINSRLVSSFRIYQRDNIDDFLQHLENYFQPKMKERLEKKTWLICEQGLELDHAMSLFIRQYKCEKQ